MTDFEGKELSVGDEVVFIYSNHTGGRQLMRGIIEKMEHGNAYMKYMHYNFHDKSPLEEKNGSWFNSERNQVKVKGASIFRIKE